MRLAKGYYFKAVWIPGTWSCSTRRTRVNVLLGLNTTVPDTRRGLGQSWQAQHTALYIGIKSFYPMQSSLLD